MVFFRCPSNVPFLLNFFLLCIFRYKLYIVSYIYFYNKKIYQLKFVNTKVQIRTKINSQKIQICPHKKCEHIISNVYT